MRVLYRKQYTQYLRSDLALVEDVLFSRVFIFLDLLFFALFLTLTLFRFHQSILFSFIVFGGFIALGSCLFFALDKGLKERSPD